MRGELQNMGYGTVVAPIALLTALTTCLRYDLRSGHIYHRLQQDRVIARDRRFETPFFCCVGGICDTVVANGRVTRGAASWEAGERQRQNSCAKSVTEVPNVRHGWNEFLLSPAFLLRQTRGTISHMMPTYPVSGKFCSLLRW